MPTRSRGLRAVVGFLLALAPAALAQVPPAAAQVTKDVNVVNTPNVNVVNTPPAPQPFQQFISAYNPAGGSEKCVELTVPAGKTLLLESVAFDVSVNYGKTVAPWNVYVRVEHRHDGGSNFVR